MSTSRLREGPGQAPPPRTTLYCSPSVAVYDVVCHARHRSLGTEEASDTHTVVFVRTGDSPAHRDLAEAAKAMLLTRYQSPPSLDELARTLGCSPFHLSRTFSRIAGVPLRRHLDRLRLRLALERLARGVADLTDLALDLGHADHSHFTNAFRREFGAPPSAFRRR
jgi:AraC-like DNA-binding protein